MGTARPLPSAYRTSKPPTFGVLVQQVSFLQHFGPESTMPCSIWHIKLPFFWVLAQQAPFLLCFAPAIPLPSGMEHSKPPSIWDSAYQDLLHTDLGLESPLPSGFLPSKPSFWLLAQQSLFLICFGQAKSLSFWDFCAENLLPIIFLPGSTFHLCFSPASPLPSAFGHSKPQSYSLGAQQAPSIWLSA